MQVLGVSRGMCSFLLVCDSCRIPEALIPSAMGMLGPGMHGPRSTGSRHEDHVCSVLVNRALVHGGPESLGPGVC